MGEPISLVAAISAKETGIVMNKETLREFLKETPEMQIKESPVQNMMGTIKDGALESLKLQNEISLNNKFAESAPHKPLYENHPGRLQLINKYENSIGNVDGYQMTKIKTLSENVDSARGNFAELVRAFRTKEAGLDVIAIGKDIRTSLGKTDIDILARNKQGENIWIENKDVKNISLTEDIKLKIDKMAEGLEKGVRDFNGNSINVDKAIFVNSKKISQSVIDYASSKGIHIKQHMDGRVFQKYVSNFN